MRKIFSKKFWKEIIVFSKYRYITKWKYRFRDMDSSWNNVNFTRNCYCFSFSVYRQYIRWNVSNWNFFFFFLNLFSTLDVFRYRNIPISHVRLIRFPRVISTKLFYTYARSVSFFFFFLFQYIGYLFFSLFILFISGKREEILSRERLNRFEDIRIIKYNIIIKYKCYICCTLNGQYHKIIQNLLNYWKKLNLNFKN